MMKVMLLCMVAVLCIAILVENGNITTGEGTTTIIGSEDTYKLTYDNLHKGNKITWDWEVEKGLSPPKHEVTFWIEDSAGNKYYETENSHLTGSFTVPFTDTWTLTWGNSYPETSYGLSLKLTHNVEIIN